MNKIRMVVLTKSSKYGNNCVAGIEVTTGNWVRLVTNDENSHGAVSSLDLIYKDKKNVQLLDVIDVAILGVCKDVIQPENVLLDLNKKIEKVGHISLEEVLKIHPVETNGNILGNVYPYITAKRVSKVRHSLTIVEVKDLEIIQNLNPSEEPKTKANFKYGGVEYENMSVTDRNFYSVENRKKFSKAILVISIGTPYHERYYKFVSAIYVNYTKTWL